MQVYFWLFSIRQNIVLFLIKTRPTERQGDKSWFGFDFGFVEGDTVGRMGLLWFKCGK